MSAHLNRATRVVLLAVSITAVSITAFATPSLAAAPQLDPGLWQFDTVTFLPMMPQPATTTAKRCIAEEQVDPLKAMEADSRCTISERKNDGTTLRWKMECPGPQGASMLGEGEVTSTGETMRGKMETSFDMNGQAMSMRVTWAGKRLGPCE